MLSGKEFLAEINGLKVAPGQCALWWMGQQSYVIKSSTEVLYLDLFLTEMSARRTPPLLAPAEVTNATMFFGSHDHIDHIDRAIWPALAAASPQASFVLPEALKPGIAQTCKIPPARLLGVNDGQTVTHRDVRITGVASAHEFLDYDESTGLYPHLGFIIQTGDVTIYHAGDTCLYEGLSAKLRQWKLDVMLLPINGRDAVRLKSGCIGNMTYQEAVDLAGVVKPRVVIPGHWDMFAHNSANPRDFLEYYTYKYPGQKAIIPKPGEAMILP